MAAKNKDRADELAEKALCDAQVRIVPDPSSARGQLMASVIATAIRKGMEEQRDIDASIVSEFSQAADRNCSAAEMECDQGGVDQFSANSLLLEMVRAKIIDGKIK